MNMSLFKNIKDFLYCISKELDDIEVFAVKGCFALTMQASYRGAKVNRLSRDLDLQILDIDKWTDMIDNFDNINKHSKLNIKYQISKINVMGKTVRYSIKGNNGVRFSVDANNDPNRYSYDKISINGVKVNFFTPNIMLADKLASVASEHIYRRTKDLYDIYLISSVFEFKLPKLIRRIKSKRDIDTSHIEIYNPKSLDDLKKGYEALQFMEGSAKPDFDEVYERIKYFTYPIYAALQDESICRIYWDKNEWVTKEEFMRNNFRENNL